MASGRVFRYHMLQMGVLLSVTVGCRLYSLASGVISVYLCIYASTVFVNEGPAFTYLTIT